MLYETVLEKRGDRYVILIPEELVDGGSLTPGDVYRVALLSSSIGDQGSDTDLEPAPIVDRNQNENGTPPVEEGEVRSVTIDTLEDQGDGTAKVERGFVVVVPGTRPGDKADIEITDVRESVAFAETVSKPEVK